LNFEYTREIYKQKLKEYRTQVLKYTRKEPLYQLDNYNHRGKGSFHLDHIISIKFGFDNNLPPEIIGNIANLRYLKVSENISKRDYLTADSFDVIGYFIEKGML